VTAEYEEPMLPAAFVTCCAAASVLDHWEVT
jgi:hypothetical protein